MKISRPRLGGATEGLKTMIGGSMSGMNRYSNGKMAPGAPRSGSLADTSSNALSHSPTRRSLFGFDGVAHQAVARLPRVAVSLKGWLLASTALLLAGTPFAAAESINNEVRTITTAVTYPDNLFVATTGTATLTIKDGGTVYHPKYGEIGLSSGSNGTVVVSGANSSWTSGGSITVGDAGTGKLIIENGGAVTNTAGYIGYATGGSGTVTVDGVGSIWTVKNDLYIGGRSNVYNGTGSLTVQNGGTVVATTTNGNVAIASGPSSVGTLTVTGAGSSFSNNSQLSVGSYGTGYLIVEKGGSVTNNDGVIGGAAGSVGIATVSGEGSTWTNNKGLYVGNSGTGSLTISDGGKVTATASTIVGTKAQGTLLIEGGGSLTNANGYIGYSAGTGTGIATVTGEGSSWTNSQGLYVGLYGNGTLKIEDGGTVSNEYLAAIGYNSGSTGTATVTGEGSTWNAHSDLIVGDDAAGTLYVLDGGRVNSQSGYIGYLASEAGYGEATVSGEGSTWASSGELYVGYYGDGTLSVTDGGTVSNDGDGDVAYGGGSEGSVLVSGQNSSWSNGGSLIIGDGGTGSMVVEKGGSVSNGEWAAIGSYWGGSGEVTVTGEGSNWVGSGELYVGYYGNGTLSVTDGGAVSNDGAGNVAYAAGTVGSVLVSGQNSSWINGGSLTVGDGGEGSMIVEKGGSVSNDEWAAIGAYQGGSGTATVTGEGSSWTSNGSLTVGGAGEGSLYVLDGGTVQSTDSYIGYELSENATGSATVEGEGSSWTSSGGLYVGFGGLGSLAIQQGGTVRSASGVIGSGYDSNGAVTVTGAGSSWSVDSDLYVGGNGSGSLLVASGGSVSNAGVSVIGIGEGSSGTALVGGAGASWTSGALYVGGYGSGSLFIVDGGSVSNSDEAVIGYGADSEVTVVVVGAGSSFSSGGTFDVGAYGNGQLVVAEGGAVSNAGDSAIGNGEGSFGRVWVGGETASWSSGGDLSIGVDGDGGLAIVDGGTVSVGSLNADGGYDGTVNLATNSGSTGLLVIGADASASPAAPGTLNAASVVFGAGDGTLIFNHTSSNYVFAPSMSGSGTIDALAGTTILTGNSAGFSGVTAIAAGATLQVGAGGTSGALGGDIVDDGALVFNRSDSLTYADSLSGSGTLTKTGAGLLSLTGNSETFTGATTIVSGELSVNGSLAGSVVTAESGTTLSGSGTVGGVVAQTGSVVAPGNSPGTLTVVGNYLQQSGSTYEAQIVPGSTVSDQVAVQGTATLESGSVLNVSKWGNGSYAIDAHYTVLTATGGVSGTYVLTGDTEVSAFYDLLASYDANDVYLNAVQTRSFVAAGATPNQKSVAAGLQSLSGANALRYAVGSLATDAEAQMAFDNLSGDFYSSIKGAMVEDSGFLRDGAVDRLRSAFGGVGASSASVASCGDETAAGKTAASQIDCPAVWAQGYGSWGNTDGDGNAASLSNDIGGFMIGADTAVLDNWRVGLLGGYSRSTYEASDRGASGSADNYSIGAYGGSQWGNIGLRLGTTYTWSDIDTARSVAFSGFANALSSSYQAGTAQVFGDVGYRIDAGPVGFEPFAGLAYVKVNTDSFTEQGGLAALTSEGDDTAVTFSTLGVRAASSFVAGGLNLTASGTLGWRHAWGDLTPTSTFTLSGSDPFSIAGVAVATDAALIDAGLTAALSRDVSVDLFYNGQFGDGVQLQGVRGALAVKF